MWQPPCGAILVGVDGSAAALGAVRWAARDAALRNAPLALVHVVDAPVPGWFQVTPRTDFRQWHAKRARKFIRSAIRVAEQSVGDLGRVKVESKVLFSAAVPALVALSSVVEMVVLGSHGHGGALAHRPIGSVTSGLVYHAHSPVAVIRDEQAQFRRAAGAPVLVGIDGSPASEAATAIAFEQALRRGVRLVALHAWDDPRVAASRTLFQDAKWDARLSAEEEVLAERLAGWHDRYPDVGVRRRIEIGEPVRWLLEASEQAQLLVVGNHGRGAFAGKVLGSVGASVVNRAKIPVIVAR
ncbi:universal stress protein [Mycobacterium sp. E2733]|uniref:universal stress protein n=1 Tax=Mycobacterium sp. E2733 TaxID=1834138 RepID=UPI0007FF5672|nr:universal stress protein [Mycobacterium sp. E2733]OBH94871.1 hypothetical protein A5678_03960 [Mycobacterium sp. E2733]